MSYYPLSLWSWQTAIKAVFLERVDIVAQYDREIRSPSFTMKLPSVIALRQYVRPGDAPGLHPLQPVPARPVQLPILRRADREELTFDHVVPRAYGGRTTWENVTTACAPCNLRKGGRTPARRTCSSTSAPIAPTTHQLQENGRAFPPHFLHATWRDYLYWDIELEA